MDYRFSTLKCLPSEKDFIVYLLGDVCCKKQSTGARHKVGCSKMRKGEKEVIGTDFPVTDFHLIRSWGDCQSCRILHPPETVLD